MANRTTLADALHQSGDRAEAARLFAEAESLQKERQPNHTILFSPRGYLNCDLLLAQGDHADALRRATRTITIAEDNNWLLDIGLDHLTLGRAHAPGSPESRRHLEPAVAFLRRAGQLDDLPRALLARATDADLEEVHKIATRSRMRLHLTDYHLAMAAVSAPPNTSRKPKSSSGKPATAAATRRPPPSASSCNRDSN